MTATTSASPRTIQTFMLGIMDRHTVEGFQRPRVLALPQGTLRDMGGIHDLNPFCLKNTHISNEISDTFWSAIQGWHTGLSMPKRSLVVTLESLQEPTFTETRIIKPITIDYRPIWGLGLVVREKTSMQPVTEQKINGYKQVNFEHLAGRYGFEDHFDYAGPASSIDINFFAGDAWVGITMYLPQPAFIEVKKWAMLDFIGLLERSIAQARLPECSHIRRSFGNHDNVLGIFNNSLWYESHEDPSKVFEDLCEDLSVGRSIPGIIAKGTPFSRFFARQ